MSGSRNRAYELDEAASDRVAADLFAHQLQPMHRWTEGDVLGRNHLGTLHNAITDYRPDEPPHKALPGNGRPELRPRLCAREAPSGTVPAAAATE